jgi:lysophospholipase L1-like esterase
MNSSFARFLKACYAAEAPGSAGVAPARYLALGDSYTIGEGVPANQRWPVQLAARLREQGLAIAEPQIIARTGWTTDELAGAIDQAAIGGAFELVSLLIGVNNQYRGRASAEYRTEFRVLLRRAIGFAGGQPARVLVLSIPDWGATPYADGRDRALIAAEIDEFNAINRAETAAAGAHFVDVTPVSRRAAGDHALIAADRLHPSGLMYAAWVDLALPAARAALGAKSIYGPG